MNLPDLLCLAIQLMTASFRTSRTPKLLLKNAAREEESGIVQLWHSLEGEAGVIMETVHQIVDGKVLSQVIDLPIPMQSILVEVTIKPAEKQVKPKLNRNKLRAYLHGSHTEYLSGVLSSQADVTLEKIRLERRMKYECFD